jgi:glycosyltransferase involved in cell wall biosynthesis
VTDRHAIDNLVFREIGYVPRTSQSNAITIFDDLISAKTLFKLCKYALNPKKLLTDMRLTNTGTCIVPMISPLGLMVECILKGQGVTVIHLLHDFKKHPGEVWPPNVLIRRIVRQSEFLIVLSSDVAEKVKNLNPKVLLSMYPHPVFNFSPSKSGASDSRNYILFIGRIRKYKGVDNLIEAYLNLKIENIDLVIAGQGILRVKKDPRIKVINRWLEESEIASLIKFSEVVVFPYIEASQSGILPYCVYENKKIVVTPLKGLLEQTRTYNNIFVAKNLEVISLRNALEVAIVTEANLTSVNSHTTKNIEACLLESGLFTKK